MTPEKRRYTIDCLNRYWGNRYESVLSLPIQNSDFPSHERLPARGEMVSVPSWAHSIAVEGGLLVPTWAAERAQKHWENVDWIAVCFWYLNNQAERAYEKKYGPVHSYSLRLKDWDRRLWQYAWVNRIALFLRKWAARDVSRDERELFGSPPNAEIYLTHDVDAVSKTMAVRIKQSIFNVVNAGRLLLAGKPNLFALKLANAYRFLISGDDYWCFEKILSVEEKYQLKSTFNFYAGNSGNQRSIKQMLLDPAYDVQETKLAVLLKAMHEKGVSIGLHQSFECWEDALRMKQEKQKLELALGTPVNVCRQHWLRFGFAQTWKAQQDIGLTLDSTLGFNDRPGFRNGAALKFNPWDEELEKPMHIESLPLIFMDSHFYDYQLYSDQQRAAYIKNWIDEIKAVGGQATVLWHQRVMSNDYGWSQGYEEVVREVAS